MSDLGVVVVRLASTDMGVVRYNEYMPELIQVGQRFGSWEVVEDQLNPYTARVMCKCACGRKKKVLVKGLRAGDTKSCGCINRAQGVETRMARLNAEDPVIMNKRYGRLVVIDNTSRTAVVCKCDCGNTTTTMYHNLKTGSTRSCGCIRTEQLLASVADRSIAVGMRVSKHNLYNTYKRLKAQCTDPNDPNWEIFGGAGITLHQPWADSILTFIKDVESEIGPRVSGAVLHRIDAAGPFAPGNIAWGTRDGLYNPRARARQILSDADRRKAVSMVLDDKMKQYDVAEHFQVGSSYISMLVRKFRDNKL